MALPPEVYPGHSTPGKWAALTTPSVANPAKGFIILVDPAEDPMTVASTATITLIDGSTVVAGLLNGHTYMIANRGVSASKGILYIW
jgi:hypothetical protein